MLKSADFKKDPSLHAMVERFIQEVTETLNTPTPRNPAQDPGSPVEPDPSHPETISPRELAARIDHTLLKPEATAEDMRRLCEEGLRYGFAGVCVNSSFVGSVSELLRGSVVLPIAVVGFPLGACSTASKVFEARQAVRDGAREIDLVIAWGALRGKQYRYVLDEIHEVVEATRPFPVKAILETAALTPDEKIIAAALACSGGAAFVKTSTGFGPGGATIEDVALLRRIVGNRAGVKASGGIRGYESALQMLRAGASRIGSSEGARFLRPVLNATPSVDDRAVDDGGKL